MVQTQTAKGGPGRARDVGVTLMQNQPTKQTNQKTTLVFFAPSFLGICLEICYVTLWNSYVCPKTLRHI